MDFVGGFRIRGFGVIAGGFRIRGFSVIAGGFRITIRYDTSRYVTCDGVIWCIGGFRVTRVDLGLRRRVYRLRSCGMRDGACVMVHQDHP